MARANQQIKCFVLHTNCAQNTIQHLITKQPTFHCSLGYHSPVSLEGTLALLELVWKGTTVITTVSGDTTNQVNGRSTRAKT